METNIQKYQAFLKTVEHGSFTKAAEDLHFSQSGISRMVSDLEAEWQLSLLERRKGGVRLTSDGTRILPYVKSLCEEFDKLQIQVDDLRGIQSGLIRIATFSSGLSQWLPGIISNFQKAYPNVDYEIRLGDYSEVRQWILEGSVDCGFLIQQEAEGLETMFLEHNEMLVVLPEDHPLAENDSVAIEDLAGEPFMMLEQGAGKEVEGILEGFGVKPRVILSTWDDYAIMSMVEQGFGYSLLTEMIMRRCPYRIVGKSLAEPVYRDLVLAYRSKEATSLALQRFIEYLPYR